DAYGYGAVALEVNQGQLELDEVWYAPEFSSNLISITALMSKGVEVRFLPDMRLAALYRGRPIFTGSVHNNLICLDITDTPQQAFTSEASNDNKQESALDLWHRRCGHVSRKAVVVMPKAVNGVELPKSTPPPPLGDTACEPC